MYIISGRGRKSGVARATGVTASLAPMTIVHGCAQDEFSEYILETRFLTSANYSTHPLRIFSGVF